VLTVVIRGSVAAEVVEERMGGGADPSSVRSDGISSARPVRFWTHRKVTSGIGSAHRMRTSSPPEPLVVEEELAERGRPFEKACGEAHPEIASGHGEPGQSRDAVPYHPPPNARARLSVKRVVPIVSDSSNVSPLVTRNASSPSNGLPVVSLVDSSRTSRDGVARS
jgi:hypothetical protein